METCSHANISSKQITFVGWLLWPQITFTGWFWVCLVGTMSSWPKINKRGAAIRMPWYAFYCKVDCRGGGRSTPDWSVIPYASSPSHSIRSYKIVNRLCPESLWDKYHPRSFHSTYNTRHCKDLQIPRYRTEFAKKAFITQLSHYGMIPQPKFVSYRH